MGLTSPPHVLTPVSGAFQEGSSSAQAQGSPDTPAPEGSWKRFNTHPNPFGFTYKKRHGIRVTVTTRSSGKDGQTCGHKAGHPGAQRSPTRFPAAPQSRARPTAARTRPVSTARGPQRPPHTSPAPRAAAAAPPAGRRRACDASTPPRDAARA